MAGKQQPSLFDDMPDIEDISGFEIPAASFVTYADLKDQRIILLSAVEEYGEYGRYYKVTLKRHNSEHELFMNVGAEQPCKMIDNILATAKFPAKAKFVKDGRTNLLVGWAHQLKR